MSSHTHEDGGGVPGFPADSLLSPAERRGLDRHVSALIDIEEAPRLELLDGDHTALVPLPASFPEEYDTAPFGDDLKRLRSEYERTEEPYILAPGDIEAIMYSMGVAPIIDGSWDGESAAQEVSYHLEMDYAPVTLVDGRPAQHLAYGGDATEYLVFEGEDAAGRGGEYRSTDRQPP